MSYYLAGNQGCCNKRAHRQARFNNRRNSKLPPSIRANKDIEYRTITLLLQLYPAKTIVVESVEARGDKGFSPVMVGQRYKINRLSRLTEVKQKRDGKHQIFANT